MIRKIVILFVFACLAVSCDSIRLSGTIGEKNVELSETYVSLTVEGGIIVRMMESCTVPEIKSDMNILPLVEVFIDDSRLVVRYEEGTNVPWNCRTEVTLPYNGGLNNIELSGASEFSMENEMISSASVILRASGASVFDMEGVMAPDVEIELSGASSFSGNMDVSDRLVATISGASVLQADGSVNKCTADISGASTFNDRADSILEVETFAGDLSGASKARIFSDGTVTGTLSGASILYYRGNAEVDMELSGDSKIVDENNQ